MLAWNKLELIKRYEAAIQAEGQFKLVPLSSLYQVFKARPLSRSGARKGTAGN